MEIIMEKYRDIFSLPPLEPPIKFNPPKILILNIFKYIPKSNFSFVKKYKYKYGNIRNTIGDTTP